MQKLFRKKEKILKQNINIFYAFFINLFIITFLTFNTFNASSISFLILELFPFLNTTILFGLVMTFIVSDAILLKVFSDNCQKIDDIDLEINKIKELSKEKETENTKKDLEASDYEKKDVVVSYQYDDFLETNKIKKKVLRK